MQYSHCQSITGMLGCPQGSSRKKVPCLCPGIPWELCNCSDPWAPFLENLNGQFWAQTQESVLLIGSMVILMISLVWGPRLGLDTPQKEAIASRAPHVVRTSTIQPPHLSTQTSKQHEAPEAQYPL